jgi:superfamily II DNA/RNA helicase
MEQKSTSIPKSAEKEGTKSPPSNTMWGSCSVGPILRSRLANLEAPTPIQEAAFSVLVNKRRDNVILASPTSSGKTLAYLLPLMSVMKRNKPLSILIVTPTVDLAYQIQREVNRLWPITEAGLSALHVVEQRTEEEDTPLLCVEATEAPIISGTPRALLKLVAETKQSKKMASLLFNLKTVVLDESDCLLQTQGAARDRTFSKTRQPQKQSVSSTELLLSELPLDYNDKRHRIQLVCASASVGRTLRRQIMELTKAPSMDKAAVLVTADSRTKKDATRRRSSLLPPTIQHRYALRKEENIKDGTSAFIEALWDTLKQLPPAPTLVFPGKANVAPVTEALQSTLEFRDVRTLQDRKNDCPLAASKSWNETTVYVMGEKFARGLDIPVDYVILSAPPSIPAAYMHLAGRTGRNGRPGTAITLVQGIKEARRVAALAGALGVGFEDFATASRETVAVEPKAVTVEQATLEDGSACQISNPWEKLAKSALTRKTVAELTEYLMERVSKMCFIDLFFLFL